METAVHYSRSKILLFRIKRSLQNDHKYLSANNYFPIFFDLRPDTLHAAALRSLADFILEVHFPFISFTLFPYRQNPH